MNPMMATMAKFDDLAWSTTQVMYLQNKCGLVTPNVFCFCFVFHLWYKVNSHNLSQKF